MSIIDKLDQQFILQSLEDGLFPGGLHLFDTIDSTNDWSLAEIRRGRELPFACIADHQRKGRGRRNRHWLSPARANIYFSLAWLFDPVDHGLGLLSLAQGVAVTRTLRRIGISDAWLKWPNDVLIENDKIAGILIETSVMPGGCSRAVIGIGLNYCMPDSMASETSVRWTDIAHALDARAPDRNAVVSVLIAEVVDTCRRYQSGSSMLLGAIEQELSALNGRVVSVNAEGGGRVTGTVLGISATGELRVFADGQERRFSSADVSLTGIDKRPGVDAPDVDD